jgi:hypothetical protein
VRTLFFAMLAVAVAGGVACRKAPATGVSVDSSLSSALSPDTKALLSIDVKGLVASDLYHRHQADFASPRLDQFAERLGVDPRRDLRTVLIAWNGSDPLLMARGTFSARALEQKLADRKAGTPATRTVSYQSFTLFSQGGNSIAVDEKGFAMAAPSTMLRAALDRRATGEGRVPEELRSRLGGVLKGSQIWEVSRGGLPLTDLITRTDIQSALSNIVDYVSETTLGLAVDSGVHLKAEINCVSPEGAKRVKDAMRGMIGLGRLTTNESNLDLLRLWDGIDVKQQQQAIEVRADLPADLTDKLLKYLPDLRSRVNQTLQDR